jgi:site-specific recombinase XerD
MKKSNSLRTHIKQYIDYIDVKSDTKVGYSRILLEFASYVDKLPNLPTRQDVIKYRELIKKRLKASSVQKHIVVIRNFYRWYYIEGYGANIAEGVKGMKIESDFKREALSIKDSQRLLKRAETLAEIDIIGIRNYTLIALLITTGLRTIEVERSNIDDIVRVDDEQVLYVRGKGRDEKNEYVKLSPQVYNLFEIYQQARSDNYESLFINHCSTHKGTRLRTRMIRGIVKEYLRQIGIDNPRYSAHSLRHTTATLSLEEGATIDETQQLLRHKDPATTQIYIHRMKKRKEKYEHKISDRLFGKP